MKMKRSTKIIIGVVVLVLIAGGVFGILQWNQPHRDIHDEAADFEISASALAAEFQKDAAAAQKKYSQKVVNFDGTVSEVTKGDSLTSISIKGNDFCGLICEMLPGTAEDVAKVKAGDQVKIKAFFMGYIEGDAEFAMPGDILFKKGLLVK